MPYELTLEEKDDILEAEEENKLNNAFKDLKLVVGCLENSGFDIDKSRINLEFFKEYKDIGFNISEDSKMKIKIFYYKHDGLKVVLEEKSKNPIVHSSNELRRLEIRDKFKDFNIGHLLADEQ